MRAWLRELLIVVAGALLCCIVLTQLPFLRGAWPAHGPIRAHIGHLALGVRLDLTGLPGKKRGSGMLAILVVSQACRFCQASLPFHRRFIAAAAAVGIPTYVAVPDVRASASYLSSLGPSVAVDWRYLRFAVSATPTIVLVGPDNTVKAMWIGTVGPKEEMGVLAAVSPGVIKDYFQTQRIWL
jgi:hypothetical protein